MENDVTQTPSPAGQETVQTPEEAPKGSKTPEANLYAALEEERRLRKEAEQKARELETKVTVEPETEEIFSDEGKVLQSKIGKLESELLRLQEERELERTMSSFPAIKDKLNEFEEYRKEYPRHKLENVAKLFLSENGLLDEPVRKGLERPVAGPKTPPSNSMTSEEVAHLRKTNYKRYTELITSGKLRPEDIK